jgi:hypothetical protein
MPDLTPEQRSLRARIAAHTRWSREPDRDAATKAGRQAFLDRFEAEVDPEGRLDPAERATRAENARRAYFSKLALQSSRARSRRAALAKEIVEAEREMRALGVNDRGQVT